MVAHRVAAILVATHRGVPAINLIRRKISTTIQYRFRTVPQIKCNRIAIKLRRRTNNRRQYHRTIHHRAAAAPETSIPIIRLVMHTPIINHSITITIENVKIPGNTKMLILHQHTQYHALILLQKQTKKTPQITDHAAVMTR